MHWRFAMWDLCVDGATLPLLAGEPHKADAMRAQSGCRTVQFPATCQALQPELSTPQMAWPAPLACTGTVRLSVLAVVVLVRAAVCHGLPPTLRAGPCGPSPTLLASFGVRCGWEDPVTPARLAVGGC